VRLDEPRVYILPKKLDEEVARLHLEKIGVKLMCPTPKQSGYLGVPVDGPYKSEFYRTNSPLEAIEHSSIPKIAAGEIQRRFLLQS